MTAESGAECTRETALDRLRRVAPESILRRRGPDHVASYRLEGGEPVERAVFDDGRVGKTYSAAAVLDGLAATDVDVVGATAWPGGGAP